MDFALSEYRRRGCGWWSLEIQDHDAVMGFDSRILARRGSKDTVFAGTSRSPIRWGWLDMIPYGGDRREVKDRLLLICLCESITFLPFVPELCSKFSHQAAF